MSADEGEAEWQNVMGRISRRGLGFLVDDGMRLPFSLVLFGCRFVARSEFSLVLKIFI